MPKAVGQIKDYKIKTLVSGDKSLRITLEFNETQLKQLATLGTDAGETIYTINFEEWKQQKPL